MEENYYCKFINFLKTYGLYDEAVFNYIRGHSILYDYLNVECHDSTGIYLVNDKNNKLFDFYLIVPIINSEKTLFINIHEYVHAIDAYYKLGKRIRLDDSSEIMSLLFEKLYLSEVNSEKLNEYKNKLNELRTNSCENKYILGLKIADELLINYNKKVSLKTLKKKSKRLLKKYKYLN